ncbi:TonB-dependent receptor family protein [Luteolibacter marinus]|uniref:TonB-dependent receptor family protein n=1 Tax=Luteolibacter marinus TaxID=2776705 RepID=UPI0018662766|nr:TonB-dependent receptor [Luteolibacter marinus]
MNHFQTSICIAAGLGGFPVAPAQSPELLDPMVVDAGSSGSLTVTSSTTRREELEKTPGGVEVVDAERYLTGRSSTVADTFALSAGVFAQPRFGSDEARLSIRGSGLQRTFHGRGLWLMQDGVPLNLADGGFDFQAIDPLSTDSINIWRGSNALPFGSSTLGGAIGYVSHTGVSSPGYSARVEAGSFGYLRARVDGGFNGGAGDVFVSLSQQSQEGFRKHADQNNQRLFANFGWRPADNVETRVFVTSVITDSELPGNLTKAELELDPRMAAPGNIALDQKRDFELFRIASKTTVVNGDSTLDLIGAWTYKDLDHPIYQVIDQESNDGLLRMAFTHTGDLWGREQLFRAGVMFQRGRTMSSNYANLSGDRGALLQRNRQTATNLEAFVESQIELVPGLTGVLGAAASRNLRENERLFGPTPSNSSYNRTYENIAPKIGLRWDLSDIQVYGNVSGSYEPPSFSESGTAVVANEAQTATTFELGSRGEKGPAAWDLSLYYSEIEDELLTVQLPAPAPVGATGTINANRTVHQGIEFAGEIDLLGGPWDTAPEHRLVFRSAWTYGDFRFHNDPVYGDNRIAGLPEQWVRGELMWENDSGWYAGPTFEWVPVKSWIDHRNTYAADPYALVGFKFGRRVEDGISWFVEGKNLTGERYAATTGVIENANGKDQRQFLPGDGRGVYAGIEVRW